jgi:membrane-associated phospholipid phosphatase
MEPYFAGDVAVARAIQAALPGPGWWATPVSRLAPAPARYYVMAIALVLSFVVARWRGLLIAAGFVLLEHYFAESTKAIFSRPRPSPELIAVAGNPSGFSFPSTTLTVFAATCGTLAVLTWHSPKAPLRWVIFALASGMLLLAGIARVALGAHWPSDVILTTVICLSWIWATSRAFRRR